jgi:preprotein translocase subunit SecE
MYASVTAIYAKAVQFLRDVQSELRKVTFPSRHETLASTAVVIVVVFVMATYLGLVDVGISFVIRSILR